MRIKPTLATRAGRGQTGQTPLPSVERRSAEIGAVVNVHVNRVVWFHVEEELSFFVELVEADIHEVRCAYRLLAVQVVNTVALLYQHFHYLTSGYFIGHFNPIFQLCSPLQI